MFNDCKSKFWLYDPKQIFKSADIIPMDNMSFEEQLNSITRLIIIIYIILGLMEYQHSIQFFILSIIFIILIFLINKEMTKNKENFEIGCESSRYDYKNKGKCEPQMPQNVKNLYAAPQEAVWCSKPENVTTAQFANNMALIDAGYPQGNPKTKIPPIIPPKALDNDFWKPNEFVVRPEINELPRKLWKQSGYLIPENCDKNFKIPNPPIKKPHFKKIREPCNTEWKSSFNPDFEDCCSEKNVGKVFNNVTLKTDVTDGVKMCNKDNENVQSFLATQDGRTNLTDLIKPIGKNVKENFQHRGAQHMAQQPGGKCNKQTSPEGDISVKYGIPIQLCQPQDGDMIDGCGYNPRKQVFSNIPANQPSGACQEFPTMVGYNESLNTQILQPGVYTKTEVMEPQVWNLGISHTQQFQPVKESVDQFGNKIFTQQNPRINCSKNQKIVVEPPSPNYANVYDPRGYGYGSNNRMYIDPLTGRPRFYYDDINAIREGNFFIRSNVDSLPYTDHYGQVRTDEDRKEYLDTARQRVNDSYLNGTLQNRTELQERLMRKYQERARQQKQAPIHTRGTTTGGGLKL